MQIAVLVRDPPRSELKGISPGEERSTRCEQRDPSWVLAQRDGLCQQKTCRFRFSPLILWPSKAGAWHRSLPSRLRFGKSSVYLAAACGRGLGTCIRVALEKKAGNQSCWKHPACAFGDLPGHQPIRKSCGRLAGNCGVSSLVVDSSSNKRVPWRKQMVFASRRPLPWPGSSRSVPAAKAISAMALLSPRGSAAECSAGPAYRTAGAAVADRLLGRGFSC